MSERRLVRGAQRGSAEDFEALFALHWPRAYRTAWLVVHDAAAAEDIAQEAFIAALRALDSFDRRRPFGPWLTRIVVNRAIDWARARRLQAVPSDAVAPAAPPDEGWSEEIVAALRSLPVDQRAVVILRHGLGYTPGEIARMLELRRGTVNSRLRRTGASWSPHGRFAVVWRERRLAAVDRRGHVRWSLLAPRPVTNAAWSPSGFRVAYRAGQDLRVVAGDGTGDRLLDPGTFRAMAWRPGRAHVLAYLSGAHIDIVDVDSGVRLARIRLPHVPHELAWSADGRRLIVNLHRSLAIYDASGRRTGRIWMPGRRTATTFVPARGGSLVAVARRSGASSEVALMGPGERDRVLFRADGRFTRLRFSPSGRWLLAAWPLADQWVFLRPGATGARRVLAAPGVTRRIGSPGFPQLSGWCCPP